MKPTTNRDPLLRQIFTEQERLRISNRRLAKLSGIGVSAIGELRHPDEHTGKRPTLGQVRALALALDFKFPERLSKE
jgi:hypothetical protein